VKVYFILDDTVFYHPLMLDVVLTRGNYEWIGVALSRRNYLEEYVRRHILDIGLTSAFNLIVRKNYLRLYAKLVTPFTKRTVTLCDVLTKHKVPYIYESNVNGKKFLSYLRKLEPDIIVSSNSQIFKKELLALPKIACINRHSALLPSYGGILPVFQAVAHGEKEVGVSVHYMVEGIDEGRVIVQEAIPIEKGESLSDIYKRCFNVSAKLIVEALDILENNKKITVDTTSRVKSYYSFPMKEHWKMFKKNSGRFA
jgi:methionyl-tRNA formyltransferase